MAANIGNKWTAARRAAQPDSTTYNARYSLGRVLETIARRCIPEPNTGCYLWEGCVSGGRVANNALRPSIRLNGRMAQVSRVVFEARHGSIPSGVQVLHRCDQGFCCNVDHLFAGSGDDNHADKAAKDRGKKRLTHEKAIEIHRLARAGMPQYKIAKEFDVHQSIVSRILAGRRRPLALLSATQE
jgi:Autographiviridae endonuclease